VKAEHTVKATYSFDKKPRDPRVVIKALSDIAKEVGLPCILAPKIVCTVKSSRRRRGIKTECMMHACTLTPRHRGVHLCKCGMRFAANGAGKWSPSRRRKLPVAGLTGL
jgi:hypothetical protein